MLESWHIYRETDPTNKERDPLSNLYCSLLLSSHSVNFHYSVGHTLHTCMDTYVIVLLCHLLSFLDDDIRISTVTSESLSILLTLVT